MDHKRLKEILLTFADDPATLHFERNEIIVQIQQEVISARLKQDGGVLFVEEDGVVRAAPEWVSSRIAQLDQLAYNVSQLVKHNSEFIDAPAELLDQIENSMSDKTVDVLESLDTLRTVLERRPAGVCSVQYLTSDAGEGKTTLINQLASLQAKDFLNKRSKWLLVPIALGGNPFLRLDNIIAAGLLNQLRVRRFFYEGFINLVRLGYIVLALDGFEEVFVETAGDAVSSLGNLIRDLQGEGTVLIAARTAYFDFRRLDQQARLYDSLPDYEVGFAKLALKRWEQEQFVKMCEAHGLGSGQDIYRRLRSILPENHPLLTRAVFVRRLIELAGDEALEFLEYSADVNDLFFPFVDTILNREIHYKWIDSSSGVALPLLTAYEHHDLLGLLAEEMLLNKRTALPITACQDYSDIFCESRDKSPTVARQVRERIVSHALLMVDPTKTQVAFDHDHFREFFLGELVSKYLLDGSEADLRKVLRVEPLGGFCLDTAVSICLLRKLAAAVLIERLQEVAQSEGAASFVRENCGALITRVLNRYEDHQGVAIRELTLPPNSLARKLEKISFEKCYIQSTTLNANLQNVQFRNCDFEWLEIEKGVIHSSIQMHDCRIQAVTINSGEDNSKEYFDPAAILTLLESHGIETGAHRAAEAVEVVVTEEWEMAYVRKLLAVFARTTVVGDWVFSLKFGTGMSDFQAYVLPALLEHGIVAEVPNRGGGSQRRFRLARPFAQLAQMLSRARGSFRAFLETRVDHF